MKYEGYILFIFQAVFQSTLTERFTTVEYAQMHGYPIENHYVTTEDGYILNIHRIPTGRQGQINGKVVLLVHGLFADSFSFVLLGPEKALAYFLADDGYDVWMVNNRGNTYSRNHTTLDPDSKEFWDFNIHEIGVYDIPATIDYIVANTEAVGIYYLGHSQGATAFYIMGSERPEYNEKIILYVHLAPPAYMSHAISPFLKIAAFMQALNPDIFLQIFGPEALESSGLISVLASVLCDNLIGVTVCKTLVYSSLGFSPDIIDSRVFEQAMEQFPSGGSTMQPIHYLQFYISGRFHQYDRGITENMKRYGRPTPPNYNLTAVTAPGYLIYAKNDWLVDDEIDVPRIRDELGNCLGGLLNLTFSFNHLDYVLSESAPESYKQLLLLFSQH